MRLTSLFAPLALATVGTAAHADTIRSFTLQLPNAALSFANGSSYGSATLDGSVTIDTTTGVVQSAGVFGESADLSFNATTITYQGTSNPDTPPPSHGGGGGCNDGCVFLQPYGTYYVALSDPSTRATFTLNFATNSLVDYLGSSICASGCSVSGKVPHVYDQNGDSTIVTVKGTSSRGQAILESSDPAPTPSPDPGSAPTAVTPEPSTLCLLGTGLLSAACTLRRRLRA